MHVIWPHTSQHSTIIFFACSDICIPIPAVQHYRNYVLIWVQLHCFGNDLQCIYLRFQTSSENFFSFKFLLFFFPLGLPVFHHENWQLQGRYKSKEFQFNPGNNCGIGQWEASFALPQPIINLEMTNRRIDKNIQIRSSIYGWSLY